MQDEVMEGGLRFKVGSKNGHKLGPKAECSRHCGGGGPEIKQKARADKGRAGSVE